MIFSVFLFFNHRQLPTQADVWKATKDWNPPTEEVLSLEMIEEDWLTIYRTNQQFMIGRLEQNWLGFWEVSSLASTYYPPSQDEPFTWSAKVSSPSYFFGQILNNDIKQIKAETGKDSFENAMFLNEGRFFFLKSEGYVYPVNIQGLSESGEIIYSTKK